MSSKPTPYAFAPTKNGQKLPWELGIPEDGRVLPPVPTGHRNTSGSTSTGSSSSVTWSADPSPYRPGRMWEAFREQQNEQQHVDQVMFCKIASSFHITLIASASIFTLTLHGSDPINLKYLSEYNPYSVRSRP